MSDDAQFTQKDVDEFRSVKTELDKVKEQLTAAEEKGDGTALKLDESAKLVETLVTQAEELQAKNIAIETKLSRHDRGGDDGGKVKIPYNDILRAKGMERMSRYEMKPVPSWAADILNDAKSSEAPEVKALQVQDDAQWGFLVGDDLMTEIINQSAVEIDPIRSIARVVRTARNSKQVPTNTTRPAGSWVGEGGTITVDASIRGGLIDIPLKKQALAYDATSEMLEDSEFNIVGELMQYYNDEFASDEGIAFVTGNSPLQPEGFTINTTVQANYVSTGTDAGISADWAWGAKLMVKNKEVYLQNSKFVLNRTTYGVLLSVADGESRPFMLPNTNQALPLSLYGAPLILSTSMPAVGSDNFPIAYGDFGKGYMIVDKVGLMVQVDPYTQNMSDKIRYVGIKRVGGAVIIPEAIALLKCSVS